MNGISTNPPWQERYRAARHQALSGAMTAARAEYEALLGSNLEGKFRARVLNDLGTLDLLAGEDSRGRERFQEALALDPDCAAACANRALLVPSEEQATTDGQVESADGDAPTKVALVSFLFNWPSTGGGIVHTVELAQFLSAAGYDVRLYAPEYAGWGIGQVGDDCPVPVELIRFDEMD